jgi:hypothetical protein
VLALPAAGVGLVCALHARPRVPSSATCDTS